MRRLLLATPVTAVLLLVLAFPVLAQTPATNSGARDRVVFGGNVTVNEGETVRDVFVFGGNVNMNGTAERDVTVFGGNANINGPIGRDLIIFGGNAKLTTKASVGRDVVTWGGNVEVPAGVPVGRERFENGFSFTPFNFVGINLVGGILGGLALLLAGLVLLFFFPTQVNTTAGLIAQRPGASLGLGCLALPAALVLAVICAITVVLLPLTLVIALVVVAAWIFGYAAVYLALGRLLLGATNRRPEPIPALLVGGLLLGAVSIVPLLGGLIGFVAGFVALGAALGSRFGTRSAGMPFFGRRQTSFAPAYPYYGGPGYGYQPYPPPGYTPPPAPTPPAAPAAPPAPSEPELGPAPTPKRRARKPKPKPAAEPGSEPGGEPEA